MLVDADGLAGFEVDADFLAFGDDVHAVDRIIVLADVLVALGAAGVVVEGDAGADDIEEGGALVQDGTLDQRHELLLVAGETSCDVGRAELQGEADQVDGRVGVLHTLL